MKTNTQNRELMGKLSNDIELLDKIRSDLLALRLTLGRALAAAEHKGHVIETQEREDRACMREDYNKKLFASREPDINEVYRDIICEEKRQQRKRRREDEDA